MKHILVAVGLLLSLNTFAKTNSPQVQNFVFTVPNSKLMSAPVITSAKNLDKYECMTEATRLASQILKQMTFLELNSKTTPFQLRTMKVKDSQWGAIESYIFKVDADVATAVHLKYSPGFVCQLMNISGR